jgi:UDP-galactopyranose mutase
MTSAHTHSDLSPANLFPRAQLPPAHALSPYEPPLVVYSHLRWDFVYQRPQQLMTRIARTREVVFVEEPVRGPRASWELSRPAANLVVAKPVTPVDSPGFCDEQLPVLQRLLERILRWSGIGPHTAWLFTPMAWPLADALQPDTVVYDCMDELSKFAGAPAQLAELERELLARASTVFTGGPSLHRAKSELHPRVRCFPSAVDAQHFGRRLRGTPLDQAAIARPRLGFYGVIDERLDRALIDRIASARPEWQLVMVGPVLKIPPDSLPQRPNIHYLGARRYEELPAYLDGWDVCLLPFAENDATRFISPTKTLEYMAAELPIVSTPIRDVSEPYGDIVYVASPEQFVEACEHALHAPSNERQARAARMRRVLARCSWDATVEGMLRELRDAEPAASTPLYDGVGLAAEQAQ